MNTIINHAVDTINQQEQSVVEGRAILIIHGITALQALVAERKTRIEKYRAELEKLQLPEITEVSVLGMPLPPESARNENQKTIAKAIETLNKAEQEAVSRTSTRLAEAIVSEGSQIEQARAEIAKKQADLNSLQLEVVFASEITGS